MKNGATAVLRVNSAGILAKLGVTEVADDVIRALKSDSDSRNLYLTAVLNRVLSIPWGEASALAGDVEVDEGGLRDCLAETDAMNLANRFAAEILNPQDAGARWCSVLLLSQIRTTAPDTVLDALQSALRRETSREILRSVGSVLGDHSPISF